MDKTDQLKQIVAPLLRWYDTNRREMFWRTNPTPYYVWVSEIMLQQTRVEAVRPYFERFIRELPDIASLAAAPEDKLLKLWEGLGYYSRARNLQKAAKQVVEQYDGLLPEKEEELLKLPGIGEYTAGAISSIAFGQVAAAVDGNVLRVITRILEDHHDIMNVTFRREVAGWIRAVMPPDRTGDFTQALMELGATVCLPNGDPMCLTCPVLALCHAKKNGTMLSLPVKPEKKARKIEKKTMLILICHGKLAIQKKMKADCLRGCGRCRR